MLRYLRGRSKPYDLRAEAAPVTHILCIRADKLHAPHPNEWYWQSTPTPPSQQLRHALLAQYWLGWFLPQKGHIGVSTARGGCNPARCRSARRRFFSCHASPLCAPPLALATSILAAAASILAAAASILATSSGVIDEDEPATAEGVGAEAAPEAESAFGAGAEAAPAAEASIGAACCGRGAYAGGGGC